MSFTQNILITGGAGFIGTHLVKRMVKKYPQYRIVNLDLLTYAGNLSNLAEIENEANYVFCKGDIRDNALLQELFDTYHFDGVIHMAAESHVDRSISNPMAFVETNILGTLNLLNVAKANWANPTHQRFYHISTDEVYGSLGETGLFTEQTPYDPRSPYSASKAGSDMLVRAYQHTFGLPTIVSNCSNNYGPYQFPEKLIPLVINNIKNNKALPVYGDGLNTRDWLWVEDHAAAIDLIYHQGKIGETYNIGGNNERKNLELVHYLCDVMDELLERPQGTSRQLITFVKDRPGHDRRYAIDASKLKAELDWEPLVNPEDGLKMTAKWYLENNEWLEAVTSGAYQQYYESHYS